MIYTAGKATLFVSERWCEKFDMSQVSSTVSHIRTFDLSIMSFEVTPFTVQLLRCLPDEQRKNERSNKN